ncbi:MAG: STAS domain-containing protein [Thiobacillus sp.]
MALPFFRKNKDKTPSPARKLAHAPAPQTQGGETLLTMDMGSSGIVVKEANGAPQSPVDEAAILYASGQADTAEKLLKDILDTADRHAWHMLFDLYSIQNREKEFEQLGLDYAVRFETSPPAWQKIGGNGAPGASKSQQAQSTSLELPGLLDKAATLALREGIAALAKSAAVRIDFSRIAMVDETGAKECAQILGNARKQKRKLKVSGVDSLIALLQDLNRAIHSRAVHWMLLLELYQTLGLQEKFEDLAVDYAVHFEVSPPSWCEVQAAEVVPAPPPEPGDDVLRFSGEITPDNDTALQKFSHQTSDQQDILVDMSDVTRVDYGSVSQLISVLMQCLGSGKTITLRGHNALIHELFRVMGIDQLAQLQPLHPD